YQILARDSLGNNSDLSAFLPVRTAGNSEGEREWKNATWYADNTTVTYLGQAYHCVMQHTAIEFWTPDKATSLWQRT
ncbi:carbohydrate-binding protein, partial [Pseudomonas sp. CCC2.2]